MEPLEEYLDEVRKRLRCRKQRKPVLLAEIADHLLDSALAFEREGSDAQTAQRLAIERFGSAETVARQLSPRTHAWQALGWTLNLWAFGGFAVLAYGLYWTGLVMLSWLLLDGGTVDLHHASSPLRPVPNELLAAFETVAIGAGLAATAFLSRARLIEARDDQPTRRQIASRGRALAAALGVGFAAWGAADLVSAGELSLIEVRNSQWLPVGVPLLLLALALRAPSGPLQEHEHVPGEAD
jgi:hypothetical protein